MQRSEELRLWIKSLYPEGDIEYDLQTIPEGLKETLKFSLPLGLVKIFSDSDYGFIDWSLRKRVANKALAKRLMCLIACSKQNQQFYKASRLLEQSGSIASIVEFTQSLKRALDVLLDIGFIKAYWLEKPRRGCAEKKSICIWKDKAPATAQNPKGMRGSYFDASQLGE